MSKIIGHFYFKLTGVGNLIGEYSHFGMDNVVVESANTVEKQIGFIGKYQSIWLENGNQRVMDLIIGVKEDTHVPIYELVWKDGNKKIYIGEGFIVDGILIGSYQGI